MDIQVLSVKENPLLRRKEVAFKVDQSGTPDRIEVKEKLAAMHNADFNLVFVKGIKARFGKTEVTGEATIYKDEESAKIEPTYIKVRNVKKDEREEAKKAAKKTRKKKKKKT